MKTLNLKISKSSDVSSQLKKLMNEIELNTAQKKAKYFRNKSIEVAYAVRKNVADSAPKQVFTDVIMGIPLERHYNYNSGFDVKVAPGARAEFVMKLSTEWYQKRMKYKGWNPVYGIIVSNYGRAAMQKTALITTKYGTREVGRIPLPVDGIINSRKRYNHPTFEKGYGNRYMGSFVMFAKKVKAIRGTKWIEKSVKNSDKLIKSIMSNTDIKIDRSGSGQMYR